MLIKLVSKDTTKTNESLTTHLSKEVSPDTVNELTIKDCLELLFNHTMTSVEESPYDKYH